MKLLIPFTPHLANECLELPKQRYSGGLNMMIKDFGKVTLQSKLMAEQEIFWSLKTPPKKK